MHGPDHIECKRIIERPKTHTLYFAVYENYSGGHWAFGHKTIELRDVAINENTKLGARCVAKFEKTITEGEGL